MPGSILPLPVMLEDEEDRKVYENLEPPKSMVLRYGSMRLIAELPYDGEAKPGCGSKLVIRSPRGIELATMLTSTCPNAGCGHAVTRKQMLQFIENSGGKDYPFTTQGKILRVATVEDLNEQAMIDAHRPEIVRFTRSLIQELDLPMRLVEVELILGGERIVFHYTSEQWVDFRELVRRLAQEYQTRIEMHQVNARDEARLVADYEKCGQHCCCRQFLKVLKPVSMRSAKVQKATLDPTKISGRCGRLMCCLRYEDQTYESLRKRLPPRNTRVKTEDGEGVVLDSQILTQLVLVLVDSQAKPAAYAVENIEVLGRERSGGGKAPTGQAQGGRDQRGPTRGERSSGAPGGRTPRRPSPGAPLRDDEIESREGRDTAPPEASDAGQARDGDAAPPDGAAGSPPAQTGDDADREPGLSGPGDSAAPPSQGAASSDQERPDAGEAGGEGRRRRRRRRRKRRGGGGGGGAGSGG